MEIDENIIEQKKQNFMSACSLGDLKTVQELLSENLFDIDSTFDDGYTGLMKAAWNNHLEVVRYLLNGTDLKQHSNINQINTHYHCSALSVACYNNHLDIVRYLLTSEELVTKADVNLGNGFALIEAYNGNEFETFEYLLTEASIIPKANPICVLESMDNFNGHYTDKQLQMVKVLLLDYEYEINDELVENLYSNVQLLHIYNHDANNG